jgi:hypothetical protein
MSKYHQMNEQIYVPACLHIFLYSPIQCGIDASESIYGTNCTVGGTILCASEPRLRCRVATRVDVMVRHTNPVWDWQDQQ